MLLHFHRFALQDDASAANGAVDCMSCSCLCSRFAITPEAACFHLTAAAAETARLAAIGTQTDASAATVDLPEPPTSPGEWADQVLAQITGWVGGCLRGIEGSMEPVRGKSIMDIVSALHASGTVPIVWRDEPLTMLHVCVRA